MFEHRIQDRQQFAHAGHQRHFLAFPRRTQALIERVNDGIVAGGHDGRHVEGRAHLRAAPQTVRFPRSVPLSRFSGATPTRAAICLCVNVPSSGKFASSVVVKTGPMPGTLRNSSSFSRQRGLCRMASARSVSA